MSVKIRLTRMGAKKKPFYRIVAVDSETRRDGRALEILGFYNPMTDPAQVQVNEEAVKAWMAKGAQPTDTVRALLAKKA